MKTTRVVGIGAAMASGVVMTSAAGGQVVTFGDSFNAFGAEMPFGNGNQNTNYVISRNDAEGIEIGVKAKERFVGQLPTDGTNRYFAQPGSPNNDGLSSWNIDFGFAFSQGTVDNYDVQLRLDFDPAAGSGSFSTVFVSNNPLAIGVAAGGGSENPGFGFWSTSIPFLVDASGWQAFDPDALGEYEVGLSVREPTTGALLAEATAFVVVPAPATATLLGLGALAARRRR